jgi:Protein of unknown function (DUF3716)
LGGKYFFFKAEYNLFKRDPYNKRLIKAVIIKVLGRENQEGCIRCEDGKGSFIGCTSIKT